MALSERVKSLISQNVPSPSRPNQEHPLVALFEDMDARVNALFGEQSVTSVTIVGPSTVEEEATIQLTANVVVEMGADTSVTWSSDDEETATVDSTGLVTGVAAGTATITATSVFDGAKSDTHEVTVTVPDGGGE